jgi:predicted nucleic acid-binding protein
VNEARTSKEVLSEYLAHSSGQGSVLRQAAVVRPESHATFGAGLELDKARPDKGHSLTDRISMVAMREEGTTEALPHDEHLDQDGFQALLGRPGRQTP